MTTTMWAVRREKDDSLVAWCPSYDEACDLAYALTETSAAAYTADNIYVDADEDGTGGQEFVEIPEGSHVIEREGKWFFQDPDNEVPEPWNMPYNHVRTETTVQTPYVPIDKTEE